MIYKNERQFIFKVLIGAAMRSILGIDAAWTSKNPSGVALVVETTTGWKLACVQASYDRFQHSSADDLPVSLQLTEHAVEATLDVCRRQHGVKVDLVAVDMPLSVKTITGRRFADDAISKKYGARGAGTHSPSLYLPGRISDEMTTAFAERGYKLQTQRIEVPALIEVYPHPALIELTGAEKRLPYKYAKCRKYWKDASTEERRSNLRQQWETILRHLERELEGVQRLLPLPSASVSGKELKTYEDRLDAAICAWVGICALTGRARAFGDEDAAIWVPMLNHSSRGRS